MLNSKDEILNYSNNINTKYLNKYLQLVSKSTLDSNYERHHILPKKLFPQYANDKDNIVRLTYSDHLLAHVYLYLIFNEINMCFALNLMINRTAKCLNEFQKLSETEIIALFENNKDNYTKFRQDLKEYSSQINKGRIHNIEFRQKCSMNTKGMVVVYDKSNPNKTFRCATSDLNYVNGNYVFYRTNKKHIQSTIDKMKLHSNKGKKAFTNIFGQTYYLDH